MYCLHYGSEMFGPGETMMLVCYIHYNISHDSRVIHVLPTLWFRNVWSWGECDVSLLYTL